MVPIPSWQGTDECKMIMTLTKESSSFLAWNGEGGISKVTNIPLHHKIRIDRAKKKRCPKGLPNQKVSRKATDLQRQAHQDGLLCASARDYCHIPLMCWLLIHNPNILFVSRAEESLSSVCDMASNWIFGYFSNFFQLSLYVKDILHLLFYRCSTEAILLVNFMAEYQHISLWFPFSVQLLLPIA
jgi:hypothetical protein